MTLVARPDFTAPEGSLRTASLASIQRHVSLGLGLSLLLAAGVGGWAYTTMISGAVISGGQVVVESDVKKVQHPTGGIVAELLVRDGAHVKAGDLLIRLDATQTRANLEIVLKALDELSARRARNEAERERADAVTFPPELLERRSDPTVAQLIESESRLFRERVAGREGQKAQLREQIGQLQNEIKGLVEQTDAKEREIVFLENELKGMRALLMKQFVPISRVTPLERDDTRMQGERGQLLASAAAARGKINQAELQILQIDQDMRTDTGKDLADIRGRWSELVEKRVAAEDLLKHIDIRSPQNGTVHQMTVHTIGGLVTPSEPAMLIVPDADELAVEVKVQPQDIDNVWIEQKAVLRFAAFNARVTPEIDGEVSRISADVIQDPKTGSSFYTARIHVPDEQKGRLGGRLVPGMPVEAFIQLGYRSVFSYLTKPMADQIAKAWRER